MLFSTFLTENKNLKNEATLVLHKIIDMVDNAHVDINENDIRFSIGTVIKQGVYDDLKVVIRKGTSGGIKLGQASGGAYAIVIHTATLPERTKIDTFLSHARVFNAFVDVFVKYLSEHHTASDDANKHEPERENVNDENFEINYIKLTKAIELKVAEYKKATGQVASQMKNNANQSRAATHKLSLSKLKGDYLGTNEHEFLSVVKKLPEYAEDFEPLNKDLSNKLAERLKSYFKMNIQGV